MIPRRICVLLIVYITYALSSPDTYECIHDDFVLQHDDDNLYIVADQNYAQTKHKPALQNAALGDDNYPNADNTKPIRFLLDTSFLDEDPGYSCFYPGEVIDYNGDPYTCTNDDILTPEREEYVRRVLLPAAHAKLTSLFMVMPVQGPLFLNRGSCGFQGGVPIPESYTRSGVGLFATDLVVFVTARPVKVAHVLAFAGQCQEDQVGRAIAGHLNLNPTEVDLRPFAHEGQLGIVLHELTHVLGFSYGKFENLRSRPGHSSIGVTWVTNDALAHDQSNSIAIINTPTVVDFVKKHFGCDHLPGGPLEDGGSAGTKLSHWEKRTFMNEYMTGEATKNPVVSGLTLSLFQDSGWYYINFSAADNFVFGRDKGCDFFQKSCGEWPKEDGYRCDKNGAMACSFDMQAKATCNLNTYGTPLPLGYQYFSESNKGGPDQLADYCPYYRGNSWCFDESNSEMPSLIDSGETFCPNCRCFASSLVRDFPFGGSKRLSCYQMECAGPSDMRVKVGPIWYTCTPNASIGVEGYGGHIFCPSELQMKAVCGLPDGAYATWPSVASVSPAGGGIGAAITISGTGFAENSTVFIHGEKCENVTVISSSEIVAVIPIWKTMGSPAHIVAQKVDVVVADSDGRTGVGRAVFSLRLSEDFPTYFLHLVIWTIDKWLAILAVLGALGAAHYVRAARRRELLRRKVEEDSLSSSTSSFSSSSYSS